MVRAGVSPLGAAVGLGGHLGGASPFSSSPYLECSPWLRTVGRKKRELREKKGTRQSLVSKGGKHNWRRGQEEESLPVCPHRDHKPWNSLGGNAAWTDPFANGEGSGWCAGSPGV